MNNQEYKEQRKVIKTVLFAMRKLVFTEQQRDGELREGGERESDLKKCNSKIESQQEILTELDTNYFLKGK